MCGGQAQVSGTVWVVNSEVVFVQYILEATYIVTVVSCSRCCHILVSQATPFLTRRRGLGVHVHGSCPLRIKLMCRVLLGRYQSVATPQSLSTSLLISRR